jgi:hypothetical protein
VADQPTDITTTIASQAVEPASASADGQSASARPVTDLIAAQQFLDNSVARQSRRRGIMYSKLIPPGALSDCGQPYQPPFSSGCG